MMDVRNTDSISLDDLLSGKRIKCCECGEGYYVPIGNNIRPENAQGFQCNNCGDRINFTPADIVIE